MPAKTRHGGGESRYWPRGDPVACSGWFL